MDKELKKQKRRLGRNLKVRRRGRAKEEARKAKEEARKEKLKQRKTQ